MSAAGWAVRRVRVLASSVAIRGVACAPLLVYALVLCCTVGASAACSGPCERGNSAKSSVKVSGDSRVYFSDCDAIWRRIERTSDSVPLCVRQVVMRGEGEERYVCPRRIEVIGIGAGHDGDFAAEEWAGFAGDMLFCGSASAHVTTGDASIVVSVAARPLHGELSGP